VTEAAKQSAAAVEARSLIPLPPLPSTPEKLMAAIRKHLTIAADNDALITPVHRIFSLLNIDKKTRSKSSTVVSLTGGSPFDKGQDSQDFFFRPDGARLSFSVTASYEAGTCTLLAYRFHLQFPPGSIPPHVRFDLNPEVGQNALVEPRSHLHVGAEDLRVSILVMSPLEVLDKIIYGMPLPG
jgi:hypothetical protein